MSRSLVYIALLSTALAQGSAPGPLWAQARDSSLSIGARSQARPKLRKPGTAKEKNQKEPEPTTAENSSGESSSRDTLVDLSPPPADSLNHPDSSTQEDVREFHKYDPHQAEKNVEVGDFYFKRANYFAAAGRYREALDFKPNDAIATFKLAASLEKLGNKDEARSLYKAYLKILPQGPSAEDSRKALLRLGSRPGETPVTSPPSQKPR